MALLWLESFDYISTSITGANLEDLIQHRYPTANTTQATDATAVAGAHGGTALKFGSGTTVQKIKTRPLRDGTVEEVCVIGQRIFIGGNSPILNNFTFLTIESGSNIEVSFRMNDRGAVTCFRGGSALIATSPQIFTSNMGWVYFEVKVRIHDTLGTIEFKFDGTSVWSETSLDTRDSTDIYWDSVGWALSSIASSTYLDDVYVLDGSGTINNDYLGDTIVETINPSSDGDSSTWTPSSGTNHSALVDEAQAMTDTLAETDYITGDATGEKDLFQYENLASPGVGDATTIHGVQVTNYCYLIEAQPADLKIVAKQNGTEGTVTRTIRHDDSAEIHSQQTIFETNPDTALLWTAGEVDTAQFGVEMV
jgi:hypothetical protein